MPNDDAERPRPPLVAAVVSRPRPSAPAHGEHHRTPSREDDHTTTVAAAAAHARVLGWDDPHPPSCRCRDCIYDEVDPCDR